jgi:phosphoribosylformylglycinamidine cyclo-ligase
VHVSYGPLIKALLKKFNSNVLPVSRRKNRRQDAGGTPIKGLAHITGGGFVDNIPRVLPKNCDIVIRKGSWEMLPIFQIIQAKGGVPEDELYQVFNMGIGMTIIISSEKADSALRFIRAQSQPAWWIGEVVRGTGRAKLVG